MGFFFVQLKPWEERHSPGTGLVRGGQRAQSGVRAADSGSRRHRVRPAGHSRPRHRRRVHHAAAGSQRRRRRSTWRSRRSASWRRRASGRRSAASARSIAPACRRSTPTSTAARCCKAGVPLNDVNTTLGALLGSSYVNDFNRFGRVYKVYMQAEPEFRQDPKQIGLFFVQERAGRDGAARHAGVDAADAGAGVHQPVQPVPVGGAHRRAGRRATHRRRRSTRWRPRRARYCRRT